MYRRCGWLRDAFVAGLAAMAGSAGGDAGAPAPKPLPPAEALARFKTPDDLAVDLVLSEPTVAQPVFLNFDERGRLWVVEYRQYPEPAGLTMLSRDGVWRAVYDKVPAPPPNHVRGQDRITIHEDADGDGAFERHKTFVDGLNIATACARGRGGVFVLNPPYLLFYPDRDGDDVPDGNPDVLLEGFGLEDTHSVVNSLVWGPDGWLYAAQGSTVSGRVKRPGSAEAPVHSMGQLIWRYHPETSRYEVFAEGGGNAFGVEVDAKGRIYSGHNGGDTRGFHYVQGGYSRKGFDKHGPLSNPYAFGYFPAMTHPKAPRFTHTFVIDEADALPARCRGHLFAVAPLQGQVVESEIVPEGSTFRTRDVGLALSTSDPRFRPVDVKLGPDGSLYVADWYDGQVNHYRNHEGQIDKTDGRVYRLRAKGAKPAPPVDLGRESTAGLVGRLKGANRWERQTALRLLGDRKDASAVPALRALVDGPDAQPALEGLWGLNLSGGLDEPTALSLLGHRDPFVRLWTARLVCDPGRVSPDLAKALADRAKVEENVEARSQLACSARRLPAADALPVVRNLLGHDEDTDDPHLPLLLWWAVESKAADRAAVLGMFREKAIWERPIVRRVLAERLMRRYAASGGRDDLAACAELLKLAPGPADAARLMTGFEAALAGRPLAGLPDALAEALERYQAGGGSVVLDLRRGKPGAVDEALKVLGDPKGDRATQLRYVQVLGEVDQPRALPALLALARSSADGTLQSAALSALPRYADPSIGAEVVAALPGMTDDVRAEAFSALATRPAWALSLLDAVRAGKVEARSVPADAARRLTGSRDARVAAGAKAAFGDLRPATRAALQAEIERLAGVVRGGPGDPRVGERLFVTRCGACHAMFGRGGRVGPELTTYRRDDLDTLLLNVVNPSAEIREGYAGFQVATTDGRSLSGVLVDQDPNVVVLRGGDGRDSAVRRPEIEEMKASTASLMPEGILDGLAEREVRDLFAYLRSTQPPK